MAEENTTTEEPQVLNGENTGADASAGDETPRTFTAEEVAEMIEAEKRKLSSASEKGVQKLIKSQKLLEEGYEALSKIADDREYLIELSEQKPEVAKIVLDKFYEGMNIDEYKESIGYEEDLSDPRVLDRKAEQKAQKIIESKTITEKTNSFVDKLQMSEEEKEKFMEAFEERKQLKSFNVNDIERHLEKAYREISDNPLPKTQEIIAKTQATGEGRSDGPGPTKSNLDKSREEAREFLKAMGL